MYTIAGSFAPSLAPSLCKPQKLCGRARLCAQQVACIATSASDVRRGQSAITQLHSHQAAPVARAPNSKVALTEGLLRSIKATRHWQQVLDIWSTHRPLLRAIHISAMVTHLAQLEAGTRPSGSGQTQQPSWEPAVTAQSAREELPKHSGQRVPSHGGVGPKGSASVPSLPKREELLDELLLVMAANIGHFEPRQLANCIWAVAKLQHPTSGRWRRICLTRCWRCLASFEPQHITNLAWALATKPDLLHFRPHPAQQQPVAWLSRLVWVAGGLLHRLKPQELSNLMWAFGRLHQQGLLRPSNEVAACMVQAAWLAVGLAGELSGQEVCNVLWALVRMQGVMRCWLDSSREGEGDRSQQQPWVAPWPAHSQPTHQEEHHQGQSHAWQRRQQQQGSLPGQPQGAGLHSQQQQQQQQQQAPPSWHTGHPSPAVTPPAGSHGWTVASNQTHRPQGPLAPVNEPQQEQLQRQPSQGQGQLLPHHSQGQGQQHHRHQHSLPPAGSSSAEAYTQGPAPGHGMEARGWPAQPLAPPAPPPPSPRVHRRVPGWQPPGPGPGPGLPHMGPLPTPAYMQLSAMGTSQQWAAGLAKEQQQGQHAASFSQVQQPAWRMPLLPDQPVGSQGELLPGQGAEVREVSSGRQGGQATPGTPTLPPQLHQVVHALSAQPPLPPAHLPSSWPLASPPSPPPASAPSPPPSLPSLQPLLRRALQHTHTGELAPSGLAALLMAMPALGLRPPTPVLSRMLEPQAGPMRPPPPGCPPPLPHPALGGSQGPLPHILPWLPGSRPAAHPGGHGAPPPLGSAAATRAANTAAAAAAAAAAAGGGVAAGSAVHAVGRSGGAGSLLSRADVASVPPHWPQGPSATPLLPGGHEQPARPPLQQRARGPRPPAQPGPSYPLGPDLLAQAGPQELSNMVLGLACMRCHPPITWQQAWLQALARCLPRFQMQNLANVCWALGRLRARPPTPLLAQLLLASAAKVGGMSGEEAVQLVTGLVAMRCKPHRVWLNMVVARVYELLPSMSCRELGCMLCALSRLGHRPPPLWLHQAMQCCQPHLASSSPQALAMLMYSLGRLGFRPLRPWLAEWLTACARQWAASSLVDLTSYLQALMQLQVVPSHAWLRGCGTTACSLIWAGQGHAGLQLKGEGWVQEDTQGQGPRGGGEASTTTTAAAAAAAPASSTTQSEMWQGQGRLTALARRSLAGSASKAVAYLLLLGFEPSTPQQQQVCQAVLQSQGWTPAAAAAATAGPAGPHPWQQPAPPGAAQQQHASTGNAPSHSPRAFTLGQPAAPSHTDSIEDRHAGSQGNTQLQELQEALDWAAPRLGYPPLLGLKRRLAAVDGAGATPEGKDALPVRGTA